MENASKALIMAGGILVGVLVLSLMVYLFADFGSTFAQINAQNKQNQLSQFNSKFTAYEDKEGLTIYDVITVAGYAKENNKYYEENENNQIIVYLENKQIQENTQEQYNQLIQADRNTMTTELPTYSCKVMNYNSDGRIKEIKFNKK